MLVSSYLCVLYLFNLFNKIKRCLNLVKEPGYSSIFPISTLEIKSNQAGYSLFACLFHKHTNQLLGFLPEPQPLLLLTALPALCQGYKPHLWLVRDWNRWSVIARDSQALPGLFVLMSYRSIRVVQPKVCPISLKS